MRIGLVHDSAGTRHAGGVAVYVQHLAAELASTHEVFLYTQEGNLSKILERSAVQVIETPSFHDHLIHSFEPVVPIGEQGLTKLVMYSWMRRNGLIDHIEENIDVLCTFQYLDDIVLSNMVDVPTLFEFHGLNSTGLGTTLWERYSQTEHVLANSPDTARRFRNELGFEVDGVVTPGIDSDRFRPGANPAFMGGPPTILFVGRIEAEKGIFETLEAIAALDQPVELRVVGDGDVAGVVQRSLELGIRDAMILEGEVPHLELPGYYVAADVVCMPSHVESFCMVVLEAMACGTPVVASDLSAITTYFSDGDHGRLIQPGDPTDIEKALLRILEDPALRSEMGDQARERARLFSWTRQARVMERHVATVAGERDKPAEHIELEQLPVGTL